jgi:outer membrane lipoprotein-sorting protein
LKNILKRLSKENKIDLIVDPKKFEQISRDFEKLKKKFNDVKISPNVNTSMFNSEIKVLEKNLNSIGTRQIRLVNDSEVQRVYTLNKSLTEMQKIMFDKRTGNITSVNTVDFKKQRDINETTIKTKDIKFSFK